MQYSAEMRHLARVPYIYMLTILLLASCGKQYKAKGLVKDFVRENAVEEVSINSFSDLDSTRVISDSTIQALREGLKQDPMFKPNSKLTAERKDQTLFYIRMRYQEDTLELSKTFYFNADLEGIVAVK